MQLCVAHIPRTLPYTSRTRCISFARQYTSKATRDGYISVIGLEIHCQLKSATKLFSSASARYDDPPNTNVAMFDAAIPGALPKLSKEPTKLAVSAALALNCEINAVSTFDRKHYFYHDLPPGYQITQKYRPLAVNGFVQLSELDENVHRNFRVGIQQIQLEQDTAKSTVDPLSGKVTIDLNRAGVALIEIVSDADMRTPQEAAVYVKKVQSILRRIGASDGDMEKGSLRIDVNVSVQRNDAEEKGTRCEIKNLNSMRFMMHAIEYEISRQIALLEAGEAVLQETRGFDAVARTTHRLRGKEDAPDYRYMPDPDVPPLRITEATIEELKQKMPELPDAMRDRIARDYGLSNEIVQRLCVIGADAADPESFGACVRLFEETAQGRDAKMVGNWIVHELLGALSKHEIMFMDSPVTASDLGLLLDAMKEGKITSTSAKAVLQDFVDPSNPIALPDLIAAQATSSSDDLVDTLITSHPKQVQQIQSGQEKVIQYLVGQGMKQSKGKANAQKLAQDIRARLLP